MGGPGRARPVPDSVPGGLSADGCLNFCLEIAALSRLDVLEDEKVKDEADPLAGSNQLPVEDRYMPNAEYVEWQPATVTSPHLAHPVSVVAAKDITYISNANRLQSLSLYLPKTPETSNLIGTPARSLPSPDPQPFLPPYLIYIHGGAWRDPQLTSSSVEPAVAYTFSATGAPASISAVASINYSLSQYPSHPTLPYDAIKENHTDLAREAVHPQHVSDVLHGLALLRSFGLTDRSYILSGHSAGACLAFQALLQPPRHYGLGYLPEAPCPAAILGLNGLYDLPELVDRPGTSHEHLRDEYERFLSSAFGTDKSKWPTASPARFDPSEIAGRVREGSAPQLVVLDQSTEDQLVPMNQSQRLEANLSKVNALQVVEGHRCTGEHNAPWEQGSMIWESVQDILELLAE
jgi:kynurenine formamidase